MWLLGCFRLFLCVVARVLQLLGSFKWLLGCCNALVALLGGY